MGSGGCQTLGRSVCVCVDMFVLANQYSSGHKIGLTADLKL